MNVSVVALLRCARSAALPLLMVVGATACTMSWEEPCGQACSHDSTYYPPSTGVQPAASNTCASDSDCHLTNAPHCDTSSGMCVGPAKATSSDDAGSSPAADADAAPVIDSDAGVDEASVQDPDSGEAGM